MVVKVAEVVPLKQGLKQTKLIYSNNTCYRCRGSSIKTRIETIREESDIKKVASCRGSSIKTRIETLEKIEIYSPGSYVAEVVPLKQGLKLNHLLFLAVSLLVAEVVPLKQGLKLTKQELNGELTYSCRGSSIKTRIETL